MQQIQDAGIAWRFLPRRGDAAKICHDFLDQISKGTFVYTLVAPRTCGARTQQASPKTLHQLFAASKKRSFLLVLMVSKIWFKMLN